MRIILIVLIVLMLSGTCYAMAEKIPSENYFNKGLSSYYKGEYNDAIDYFGKAIEKNPKNAKIFYYLGDAQFKLKQFGNAIKSFSRVIQLDPKNADAYFCRGLSRARLKDYRGAIIDYNTALELDPNHEDARGAKSGAIVLENILNN